MAQQPNLHTHSQQPVEGFDPSDSSFFNVTPEQLPQVIKDGDVAVMAVVAQSGRIALLHSPFVVTDDFGNDFAIQANLLDNKSVRRFVQVELSSLGFFVSFTTKRSSHFSMGAEITDLAGTRNFARRTQACYARLTPNFVLVPYANPNFLRGKLKVKTFNRPSKHGAHLLPRSWTRSFL